MFRPISSIGRQIKFKSCSKQNIRNKVIRPASILNPAEKIKLYQKENKELFGPLLETNKQKKRRLKEAAKNKISHQNNDASSPKENTKFEKNAVDKVNFLIGYKNLTVLEDLKKRMFQNTKLCVNLVGALLNTSAVRGIKTVASSHAASSPAQPGYASEDGILQIKPYQNDFAKQYPSVTLILNKTMTEESRAALEKWKQERIAEMGLDAFNKFYEAQMAVGTKFHSTLKNYFTQPQTQLRIEKEVEGVWVSVSDLLKSISSPKAIESNVIHPVLKYRGIFDAIADYEDKPTLIEWKKSDKPRKSISLTYDNPVQLAAYFGAVCNDLNYKHLNVRDALLVIAYTDGSKADAYHLTTDKLREHWAQWLIRLEDYMKKHGNAEEKILKGGKRLFEEDIENLQ
ncbi:mitochondrial genome maintenance exonuclease 1-like isoform X1 [Galleria mellonella]|uniref:Mitochondrial genome maintenance exonuclease 1 n=1 Tax=Galleria mellonella TaxID=7137 RepID=A0ABM3MB13_GALME|nr:mitochondrial genome maintenance exonuclease 1-like isoform X1 [Galleria mellonella]XP_052748625.1 mitochondrial genome maintenance exonuclease 1-like isoform X1 [Galleria mellonella]